MADVKVELEELTGKIEELMGNIKRDLPKVIEGQAAASKRFRVDTTSLAKLSKEARKLTSENQKAAKVAAAKAKAEKAAATKAKAKA